MSPQLYPTPAHPGSNTQPNNTQQRAAPQQQQPQSFISRYRWPLFLTSYLALGGLLSLPSFQKRLHPRTASLVRGSVLGFAVLGGLGLSATEVLKERRQKKSPLTQQQPRNDEDELLSDEEREEKRRVIQEGGMQRD